MNEQEKKQEPSARISVKPYTLKELARIYGVCTRTLKKWINEFKSSWREKGKMTRGFMAALTLPLSRN